MDYFAHGFWSYILFHKCKKVKLAVFFGLLPDNLSWLIYLVYGLFTNSIGEPVLEEIPKWVFILYGISHSLIISLSVILITYIIFKKLFIYLFAWPIAICFDILTHKREFLPTPFLWPLSTYKFDGISWGDWRFMLFNWTLILILLIYIYRKK